MITSPLMARTAPNRSPGPPSLFPVPLPAVVSEHLRRTRVRDGGAPEQIRAVQERAYDGHVTLHGHLDPEPRPGRGGLCHQFLFLLPLPPVEPVHVGRAGVRAA